MSIASSALSLDLNKYRLVRFSMTEYIIWCNTVQTISSAIYSPKFPRFQRACKWHTY